MKKIFLSLLLLGTIAQARPLGKIYVEDTKFSCFTANGIYLNIEHSATAYAKWGYSSKEFKASVSSSATASGNVTRIDLANKAERYFMYLRGLPKTGQKVVLYGVLGTILGLGEKQEVPEGTPLGFTPISTVACDVTWEQ